MVKPESSLKCLHCGSQAISFFANTKDIEYFSSEKEYSYYHCTSCNVLFIDPVPLNLLQLIYPKNYYSFNNQTKGFSFRIKNYLDKLFFKKLLKQIEGNSLNVLDVGGGTGWLTGLLKSIDKRITLTQVVDIDKEAESIAIKNGHQYFCGRMEDFETTAKFDLILMLNLIEHVANPTVLLQKAGQLLNKGGIIIIKTPNYKSWDARLFKNNNWGGYHCPRHWIIFDKSSAEKLISDCSLTVKEFTYTQGAPFWTVSILHYLHKKKWIKASPEKPLIYHPLFGIISIITAAFDFIRKPFAPLSQMFFIITKK